MKNIHKFILFSVLSGLVVNQSSGAYIPYYLNDVANAWISTLDTWGISADIATYMREAQTTDAPAFRNSLDIVAYNDTTLNIYNTINHINAALSFLTVPETSRRAGGKSLSIDVDGFAQFDEYNSDANSDFKTNTFGLNIRARAWITNGFAFGIAYTNSHLESKNTPVESNGNSNSISIFSEYTGKSGLFINMGINGGSTRWKIDKNIASIPNGGAYNADFYAGRASMGMQMTGGAFAMVPYMGAQYVRVESDKHSDDATQTFDKWWYNLLTANAGINFEYTFIALGAIITPGINIGGTYDAISNGTDAMRVQLLGGQTYIIPIDAPHRAGFDGGIGINMQFANIALGADYKLNARSNYTAHTAMLNIKYVF